MAKPVTPFQQQRPSFFQVIGGTFQRRRAHLADIAFLSILAFTLATRLLRLSSIPAVYPDEANFIEFSHHLLRNHFEWGIFSHTFLPAFLCRFGRWALLARRLAQTSSQFAWFAR